MVVHVVVHVAEQMMNMITTKTNKYTPLTHIEDRRKYNEKLSQL
jgi:hypothetical protein